VFDRLNLTWLATFGVAQVADSDSMTLSQETLPGYPSGGLFVQNNGKDVRSVSWQALAAATGMSTCTP
jgi:hypothetical protein